MEKFRTPVILALLIAIIAGGAVFVLRQTPATYPIEIILPPPSPAIEVYVSGEVQNPGIHILNVGARVAEAIEAAGGFGPDADRDAINLARKLRDGAQIHVLRIGEAPQRVNINTADAWLLRFLPGIGAVLSERIIEHRTEHGPFESIDELKMVEGIRTATFEKLKDKITVHCGAVFVLRQTPATYSIEITVPPPPQEIEVHVSGEVQNPGIYVLNEGARVSEAIEAAGGFGPDADRDAINLARKLRDGAQVHVRKIGEAPQRVNINTADAWLLDALPGIGEVLSARIIEHRSEHGPFESIDELKMVRGIRQETFERIRDKITVH